MKIDKQNIYNLIERTIGEGVINMEEADITATKILNETWKIIQYLQDEANNNDKIAFAIWLTGHDKETIMQMYQDFRKRK